MRLACPRCRGVTEATFVAYELVAEEGRYVCSNPACGASYPVVDGIPVIFRNEPDARGDAARARRLVAAYAEAWESPAWPNACRDRLEALVGRLPRGAAALDLCAGTARAARPLATRFGEVVALDAYYPLLREGRTGQDPATRGCVRAVCADALDPPFFAESFQLVYLGAALDSVRNPMLLMGQADALLAPGGHLVVATPFAWDDDVTPPDQQLAGPEALRAVLAGEVAGLEHLAYDVEEEADDLPWRLRRDARTVTDFLVHWLVARKRQAA